MRLLCGQMLSGLVDTRERHRGAHHLLLNLLIVLLCLVGLLSICCSFDGSALGALEGSEFLWPIPFIGSPPPSSFLPWGLGRQGPAPACRGSFLSAAEFSPWRPRGLAPVSLAWNALCAGHTRTLHLLTVSLPLVGPPLCLALLSPTPHVHRSPAPDALNLLDPQPPLSAVARGPGPVFFTLSFHFCWLVSRSLPPSPAPGQGDLLATLVSLPVVCSDSHPGLH